MNATTHKKPITTWNMITYYIVWKGGGRRTKNFQLSVNFTNSPTAGFKYINGSNNTYVIGCMRISRRIRNKFCLHILNFLTFYFNI